jgi:HSP20 family protein
MTNLVFRERFINDLFDFRRDFDQIFNRFLSRPATQEEQSLNYGFAPPVESFIDKDGKKFHCQILLPGVDPKDVNIQVLGHTLMISGERTDSRETNGRDFLQREITYGSFQRSLGLPEGVEIDRLSADYRNGMLEITAPVAATALPKKIEIKAVPAARHAAAG